MVGVEIVVGLKGNFLYVIRQFFFRVCRRVRCRQSFVSLLPLLVSHVFKSSLILSCLSADSAFDSPTSGRWLAYAR